MTEPTVAAPAPADRRSRRADRRKLPRHGFWKGAAAGLLLVIPAVALAVWVSARLGVLHQHAGVIACLRMTVVFAGLCAVLTAGGVGRLAAQATIEGRGGRPRAVLVAARAMAAGGAALVLIAAIPHGGLPTTPAGWLAVGALGAVAGAGAGALIGVACSGEMPTLQELGVWPPTEWPLPWPFEDDDDPEDAAAAAPPAAAPSAAAPSAAAPSAAAAPTAPPPSTTAPSPPAAEDAEPER